VPAAQMVVASAGTVTCDRGPTASIFSARTRRTTRRCGAASTASHTGRNEQVGGPAGSGRRATTTAAALSGRDDRNRGLESRIRELVRMARSCKGHRTHGSPASPTREPRHIGHRGNPCACNKLAAIARSRSA